ncbi:hypothetical protein M885DRAFT_588987 [Pelagophyceae sp. CCMP2097]|nr:hypothetical protein M885DRAFT_588987 [Pelagophyceae sp. CCMP2097]
MGAAGEAPFAPGGGSVAAPGLSAEELGLCQASFTFYDMDADGSISPNDVAQCLVALTAQDADAAEIAAAEAVQDFKKKTGGAGAGISFAEYAAHWQEKRTVEVKEIFALIDLDQDGFASEGDVAKFVSNWGGAFAADLCSSTNQTPEDIAKEILGIGADGANRISYAQFEQLMTQAEPERQERASRRSRDDAEL